MMDFVTVTLADPTAPEGVVQLLHVPALVQTIHPDGSADLTVFANAAMLAAPGALGPCFLLEKISRDQTKSKAPSFSREEEITKPELPVAKKAQELKPGERAPIVHSERQRVFGKGIAAKASSRSTSVRRFESASISTAKGNGDAATVLRQVGSPKAMLPGQKMSEIRVFTKGRGEITKKQAREEKIVGDINPEIDPLGALEELLGEEDSTKPAPGEVPAPLPMTTTNGSNNSASSNRVSSGRPL
jgi:hypothetical protein